MSNASRKKAEAKHPDGETTFSTCSQAQLAADRMNNLSPGWVVLRSRINPLWFTIGERYPRMSAEEMRAVAAHIADTDGNQAIANAIRAIRA